MCQQHIGGSQDVGTAIQENEDATPRENFPWDLGVCDAHCHPTDTMPSIDKIPAMRAKVLTIMATRAQDQQLVGSVAGQHGVQSRNDLAGARDPSQDTGKVVPAFGWHPWFSYQIYDDTLPSKDRTYDPARADGGDDGLLQEKARHLAAVLSPAPQDTEFAAKMPELVSLSSLLDHTRGFLRDHPLALVGEIGVDKAFRLPQPWHEDGTPLSRDEDLTPGGREGRLLSPHRVKMAHQASILKAQLSLAGEMGRAVSVHGVQAHGILFDTCSACWKGHEKEVISKRQKKMVAPGAEDFSSSSSEDEEEESEDNIAKPRQASRPRQLDPKPYPPRVCLHSFSGPVEVLKQYMDPRIPAKVYFSFSLAVNFSTPASQEKTPAVIKACPPDRLLVESDLHVAGDQMDAALEGMYRKVCAIKGWALEQGVQRIRQNYEAFIFG